MMTPSERKAAAEQITASPLYTEIMEQLEANAIDRGVWAPITDNDMRQAAMAEVRAIRAFRQNLEALLRDTPAAKGAPA